MTETTRLLIETSRTIKGEHKAMIAGYLNERDGVQIVNAGGDAETAYLIAAIIIHMAVGKELNPKKYLRIVLSAFRHQLKNMRGKQFAEIYKIDGRDLEED